MCLTDSDHAIILDEIKTRKTIYHKRDISVDDNE